MNRTPRNSGNRDPTISLRCVARQKRLGCSLLIVWPISCGSYMGSSDVSPSSTCHRMTVRKQRMVLDLVCLDSHWLASTPPRVTRYLSDYTIIARTSVNPMKNRVWYESPAKLTLQFARQSRASCCENICRAWRRFPLSTRGTAQCSQLTGLNHVACAIVQNQGLPILTVPPAFDLRLQQRLFTLALRYVIRPPFTRYDVGLI